MFNMVSMKKEQKGRSEFKRNILSRRFWCRKRSGLSTHNECVEWCNSDWCCGHTLMAYINKSETKEGALYRFSISLCLCFRFQSVQMKTPWMGVHKKDGSEKGFHCKNLSIFNWVIASCANMSMQTRSVFLSLPQENLKREFFFHYFLIAQTTPTETQTHISPVKHVGLIEFSK